MGGGTNGWFVVYMEDGMEDRSMVAHGKVNGRWELRNSIKYDELRDMGCLVPKRKEAHFLHTTYYYKAILNLQG